MKTVIEKIEDLEKETRKRKRRLKREFSKEPIVKLFPNKYGYDQIIAQVGIPFSALCEHHEVAFEGEVSIGYIPNKWLTGLSKLGRIVEYYLNPTVKTTQEKATHLILQHLKKTIKPKGAIVIIKARHGCICYRGVKKPSLTVTSAVDGIFKDLSVKQEFLQIIDSTK
ncbi:MAG: GTP cyclohydrolase I [Candidatus Heimdallarchaeaceae archaeon]